jgi:hypothetical protein
MTMYSGIREGKSEEFPGCGFSAGWKNLRHGGQRNVTQQVLRYAVSL